MNKELFDKRNALYGPTVVKALEARNRYAAPKNLPCVHRTYAGLSGARKERLSLAFLWVFSDENRRYRRVGKDRREMQVRMMRNFF